MTTKPKLRSGRRRIQCRWHKTCLQACAHLGKVLQHTDEYVFSSWPWGRAMHVHSFFCFFPAGDGAESLLVIDRFAQTLTNPTDLKDFLQLGAGFGQSGCLSRSLGGMANVARVASGLVRANIPTSLDPKIRPTNALYQLDISPNATKPEATPTQERILHNH